MHRMCPGADVAVAWPVVHRRLAAPLAGLLAVACAPAASGPGAAATPELAAMTRMALDEAAALRPADRARLMVTRAEAVLWSNGSLGCPQPGRAYTQALVPGYRIRIRAGAEELDFHAAQGGPAVLCPAGRSRDPLPPDAAR
jgi:hypothetical protein